MARRMTREEGILAGESCGTAMVAALDEVVRDSCATRPAARGACRRGALPDGGRNYLSKLYNDEWMRANGLLATTGAVVRVERAARRPPRTLRSIRRRRASPGRPTGSAPPSTSLQLYGISQLPVSERPDGDAIEGIVGSVSEKGLLDRAYRDPSSSSGRSAR